MPELVLSVPRGDCDRRLTTWGGGNHELTTWPKRSIKGFFQSGYDQNFDRKLDFFFEQDEMPAALSCQARITVAEVVWQARLVGQFG